MPDHLLPTIRRAQTGDRCAFASLYDQYKNLVFRSAFLILNDPQDAEDALQEVFVLVYRSLCSYDPGKAAFTTWLYRITVNYCLNQQRKRSWKNFLNLDDVHIAIQCPAVNQTDEEAIWQAVNHLSDKLRVTVILRYAWELSYAEIAEILSIPLGTVKSRLEQAIKLLRKELDRDDFFTHLAPEMEGNDEL